VVLALAPAAAQMLGPRCPMTAVELPQGAGPIPDGWQTLRAEFDDESFARFVVLGLGSRARALEPEEFRRSIQEEALAMAGPSPRRRNQNS